MQTNVTEILNAAGQVNELNKVTARHFKEISDANIPVLLVMRQKFEVREPANITTTSYNGFWNYPTVIYVKANPGDDVDYTDFTEVQTIMRAFLTKILASADWEIADIDYYEATLSGKELVAGEVQLQKFSTERFKP